MSRYGLRNPNYAVGWFAGTGDADDSGAVCPQDWVALDMGVVSTYTSLNRPSNWHTYSTAICCPSSYQLFPTDWTTLTDLHCESYISTATEVTKYGVITNSPESGQYPGTYTVVEGETYCEDCGYPSYTVQVLWGDATGNGEEAIVSTVYTLNGGSIRYKPFPISWKNDQTSTLSPKPPSLTSNMLIPTWTPDMYIEDGEYDREPGDSYDEREHHRNLLQEAKDQRKKTLGISISMGVLGGIILLLLVWRLWVLQRRRKEVSELKKVGVNADVEAWRTFFGRKRMKQDFEDSFDLKTLEIPLEDARPVEEIGVEPERERRVSGELQLSGVR